MAAKGVYRLSNDGKRKIVEAVYNRLNEQVFWDGKRREVKAVHMEVANTSGCNSRCNNEKRLDYGSSSADQGGSERRY